MALLLKNATYLDWKNFDISVQDIFVEDGLQGKIRFIASNDPELKQMHAEVLDCTGKIVTKSFAIGHHHAYSALARGMNPPRIQPTNFIEILKYIWWTLDKCLDPKAIEFSALATAIACAKAGSSFVIDHHASPFAVEGSLEIIANAFDKVGISHLLCYEISDRDGEEIARQGVKETQEYLKKHQGLVGLHASFTVGETTLKQAVEIMEKYNSGIHIHVAEDISDQVHCLNTYKKRVIERLHEAGVTKSSKTILAHCLHLSENEREIIRNSPCWVVQNMESNLNNKVGLFSGKNLGENIMLGTDGMHSDMLKSARFAYFAGQLHDEIDYNQAYNRFRNVHNYLITNNFTGDGENNLVVLDYNSPTAMHSSNFLGHFLFGIEAGQVIHLISNGRLILKDRILQTIDEDKVLTESREIATKLWQKMSL